MLQRLTGTRVTGRRSPTGRFGRHLVLFSLQLAAGLASSLHSPLKESCEMSEWDHLDLGNIRATLIRQEDTILFNLIERAQFKRNLAVYQPGADILKGTGIAECYTKHLLSETEAIHAKVRACEHTYTYIHTYKHIRISSM